MQAGTKSKAWVGQHQMGGCRHQLAQQGAAGWVQGWRGGLAAWFLERILPAGPYHRRAFPHPASPAPFLNQQQHSSTHLSGSAASACCTRST
jgi:hypothetical protein